MTSRGRGRPRATTRERIQEVALGLFAEHGYAATSLAQVAEAAGISRTTLFAYFPAKRDLIRDDFALSQERLKRSVAETDGMPVVDAVVRWLGAIAAYRAAEHDALVRRWRIIQDDDALRADVALETQALTDRVCAAAIARAPHADPALVDHVTRALMAVAARCTTEWTGMPRAEEDLDAVVARGLRPIADALRPLIPW